MGTIRVRERQVLYGPAPAWADAPPFERKATPWTGAAEGGVRYLLVDDQIKAGDGPQVALVRRVSEVTSPDGLGAVASVEMVFDPAWEEAHVHFVRVIRDGAVRELPVEGAFEVFRRERDLERAKFDGRLTAHMIVPDLRVGDIVDYCYSIAGENPVFRGHIAHAPNFQWSVAVERVRFRLLTPPGRSFTIRYRGDKPAYHKGPGGPLVERVWTGEHVEGFRYEAGTPSEWIGHARAVIAETTTWPRIADIFRNAYAPPAALPEGLRAKVAEIARRHADPAGRTTAALRLAQEEVRYLAISIGEGGLFPRSVEDIWASRFGDCKDSSRLLAAVLAELGVEAVPALVHTRFGYGLEEHPPTTMAFDHCIVRVRVDGRTHWLDPTRSPQSGRLGVLTEARFGWALPLEADAALEFMGEDEAVTVSELRHDIRFGETARSPARLEVRATLRSWRADDLRRRLANDGRGALKRGYREFYENRYGRVETVSPLELTDRPDDNEIETREVYDLLDPWALTEDGRALGFSTADEAVASEFPIPRTSERRGPINLGWPRRMAQEVTLFLPRSWNVTRYDETMKVGPIEVTARLSQDDERTVRLGSSVTVTGRSLPTEDARAYFEMADRARALASVILTYPATDGEFSGPPSAPLSDRKPWEPSRKPSSEGGGVSTIWLVLFLLFLAAQGARLLGS